MTDSSNNRCGVYLDWDNIWGGILDLLGIIVAKDESKRTSLSKPQKAKIEEFIRKFASDICDSPLIADETRYIKAFADFDRVPHAKEFTPSLTDQLHNCGIEPLISFVRARGQKIKDASDRSLILEIIEDVFFSKKQINTIIIASGDVDFYPLLAFVREHSDKRICILTFKNRVSHFYEQLPSLRNDIFFIEDLMELDKFKIEPETEPELPLEEVSEDANYKSFKDNLIEGLTLWNKKGLKAKTGLIVKSWAPRWAIPISPKKINEFFEKLISEDIIQIEPDKAESPLNGTILLKQKS